MSSQGQPPATEATDPQTVAATATSRTEEASAAAPAVFDKGKGKEAVPQPRPEEEEDEDDEDDDDDDAMDEDEDEEEDEDLADELEGLDQTEVITGGRRTRGRSKVDYTSAEAQKKAGLQEEGEEDEEDEFHGEEEE